MELSYLTTILNRGQVMVALTADESVAFIWHGGEYIDVCLNGSEGIHCINGEWFYYGQECINVWDYDKGKPEIEWLDKDAFLNVVQEWMSN